MKVLRTPAKKAALRHFFSVASFLLRSLILGVFTLSVVTVLTQDYQIYPGFSTFLLSERPRRDPSTIPPGVTSFMLTRSSGAVSEVWRLEPPAASPKRFAVLFHGNDDTLDSAFSLQQWLWHQGFGSYSMDYPGYQFSAGWPTESGINESALALADLLEKNDHVLSNDLLIVGRSLGTGPAVQLAQQRSSRALLLIAPYLSIPKIVQDRPTLKYLASFVWTQFPSELALGKTKTDCLIITHGERDTTILPHHSHDLLTRVPSSVEVHAIFDPEANHDDILERTIGQVNAAIGDCFGRSKNGAQLPENTK